MASVSLANSPDLFVGCVVLNKLWIPMLQAGWFTDFQTIVDHCVMCHSASVIVDCLLPRIMFGIRDWGSVCSLSTGCSPIYRLGSTSSKWSTMIE
jgi:hypothetical protein